MLWTAPLSIGAGFAGGVELGFSVGCFYGVWTVTGWARR